MDARLLYQRKVTDEDGDMRELVIWGVPFDKRFPQGVKYRFAFIPGGAIRPAVLYDNHHPKGYHKHLEAKEAPYEFKDVGALLKDFERDIARWKARR